MLELAQSLGFDLADAPLIRFALIRLAAERHRLVLTNHHIVMDGWSMPVLVRELLTLYAHRADAAALPRATPYRDYLAWAAAQDRTGALAAWRDALAGLEEATRLAPHDPGREPVAPEQTRLALSEPLTAVTIERSIVGAIRADRDATVRIADGIVDATDADEIAFGAPGGGPGATLTLEQVTVIGRIEAELLELVSNSLLLGPAVARRRQEGCVRFSHVPPGSLTPRRHHCVPERESDAASVAPVLT